MRGPLTHADDDDPLADRHHVAALEGGHAVVARDAVGVAEPDVELLVGERRVEPVDRRGEQGLLTPRRPVHRVQRDAPEDPRGVVAHELRVGQRPEDETRPVERTECRQEAPPASSGTSW